MTKRTWQIVLAVFVGSCVLVPSMAAASTSKNSSGCSSAVCVYREQQPTPGGNQVLGQGTGKATPLSSSAGQALSRYHGADKNTLKALATNPGYSITGDTPYRQAAGPTPAQATGSFDLGAGETALFVLLAVSAGVVVLGAAVRLRRRGS